MLVFKARYCECSFSLVHIPWLVELNVGLNLMFFKEDFYACAVFPLKGHYTTGVGPKLNMSALLLPIKMWVFLFIISYI